MKNMYKMVSIEGKFLFQEGGFEKNDATSKKTTPKSNSKLDPKDFKTYAEYQNALKEEVENEKLSTKIMLGKNVKEMMNKLREGERKWFYERTLYSFHDEKEFKNTATQNQEIFEDLKQRPAYDLFLALREMSRDAGYQSGMQDGFDLGVKYITDELKKDLEKD